MAANASLVRVRRKIRRIFMDRARVALLATLIASFVGGASAQTKTTTYVFSDPQGTPLAEADASGAIIATYDYAPYGRSVMGSAHNEPGYTGHVADDESDIIYMQARYYDPAIGRFLSIDPVQPSAGDLFVHNRFVYAENSPLVHTDPSGRCIEDACIGEAFLLFEAFEFLTGTAAVTEVAATAEGAAVLTAGGATATAATATATTATATITVDVATGATVTGSPAVMDMAAACAASFLCTGAVTTSTVATVVAINEANQHLPTSQQQAEHTKGKRKSTEGKHEKGDSRRTRDRGGEKGDDGRRYPRKPPPGHDGPWPPKPEPNN
ncbi:MAG TPA: RHS repeat-associated core domain-containing protein [Luteibacter sp.]|uniref:RHS repeat domain-containing protein n=1 Tax=Luteibacter sp. TaxID=1886636 RepID=UPI002BC96642|nr:RHS repeat-associated core domain-containing protein [Luteibacter sp.]HVI53663.1 RHS repeat-associated core domain-containing protein [Luteibacter sp.]